MTIHKTAGAFLVAVSQTGCCDDIVRRVGFNMQPMHIAVGEQLVATAIAYSGELWPSCRLFDSQSRPEVFAWTSLDTTVAVVTPRGVVEGRRDGATQVIATTAGVAATYGLHVIVSPAFSRFRLRVTPAVPRVGDTLDVTVGTIDVTGADVLGVHLFLEVKRLSDSVVVLRPGPTSGPSPQSVTLVARKPGAFLVYAQEIRTSGKTPSRRDSIVVVVGEG